MNENEVVGLFCKAIPLNIDIKNTSHGDDDFRETLLVDFLVGERLLRKPK